MAKLSVIVPFYNEEEHLDRCLRSILEQTEKDLEVILVDDGSDDGSVRICEKYIKTDSRFSLICMENGGGKCGTKLWNEAGKRKIYWLC